MNESQQAPSKPKNNSISVRILKGLAYLAAMLIIAELFYRFFWQEPPMTEVVYGNHPIYHHVPKAFLKNGIGSFDYRGRAYEVNKKPGRIRVAFLGDSFTYGFTPGNQTIPHHLHQMIKSRFPDQDVEVLNFGFVSYSPIIEEVVYRRQVAKLKPDYVIQIYDTFDPQDDILYSKSATFDEDGVPLKIAGEEFLKTGIRSSALVRFFQFAYEVVKNSWHYLPEHQRFESRIHFLTDSQSLAHLIDYSFQTLARLCRQVEKDGARFMLFQYPPPHLLRDLREFQNFLALWGVTPDWQRPVESPFTPLVLDFCSKNQMHCHDFGPRVRKMEDELGPEGSRLKIYNNEDGHFTGLANREFADFILEKLIQQGFPQAVNPQ